MKSTKCLNCGLVNFISEKNCKKCETILEFSNSTKIKTVSENTEDREIAWYEPIVIGCFFFIGGLVLLLWNWSSAINEGEFEVKSTFLAPVIIVLGLRFFFLKFESTTPTWICLHILSGIVGVLNFLYFKGWF